MRCLLPHKDCWQLVRLFLCYPPRHSVPAHAVRKPVCLCAIRTSVLKSQWSSSSDGVKSVPAITGVRAALGYKPNTRPASFTQNRSIYLLMKSSQQKIDIYATYALCPAFRFLSLYTKNTCLLGLSVLSTKTTLTWASSLSRQYRFTWASSLSTQYRFTWDRSLIHTVQAYLG